MTNELCDVVVIGGGPGGSTAATLLARRGYKVIALEKARHPRFLVDVPGNLCRNPRTECSGWTRAPKMQAWPAGE